MSGGSILGLEIEMMNRLDEPNSPRLQRITTLLVIAPPEKNRTPRR